MLKSVPCIAHIIIRQKQWLIWAQLEQHGISSHIEFIAF